MENLYQHGLPPKSRGPRLAVIGGGHGLSNMLRGLKRYTENISAIVTVADDGGGSGMLRQDLGMPPPGDIRNCLEALANTEPLMSELMHYRFTEGSLAGQSFGNLFLAALNGISPSFDAAVSRMSQVLAITGRVLPVTTADVQLEAEFVDLLFGGGIGHADPNGGIDAVLRQAHGGQHVAALALGAGGTAGNVDLELLQIVDHDLAADTLHREVDNVRCCRFRGIDADGGGL